MKKYLKILVWIIITVLILINLSNFFQIKILNKKISSFFGYYKLQIVSGSMQPTIEVGDIIIVKKANKYKIGDVISFYQDDVIITHRIIDIKDNKYITKGDYNNTVDDFDIEKKDIIGKMTYKIPKFGKIIFSLNNPIVLLLIFIIGLILITVLM